MLRTVGELELEFYPGCRIGPHWSRTNTGHVVPFEKRVVPLDFATEDDMKPFRLGINMAGAISAGAYTAGVFDFLLEALQQWEKAKAENKAVPRHTISIEVLSGASAGGICSGLGAL